MMMRRIVLLRLMLAALPAWAGEGAQYIPVYNELVRVLDMRCAVVNHAFDPVFKDPAGPDPGLNSVTQDDMNLLRHVACELMDRYYLLPKPVEKQKSRWDEAFKGGGARIMGQEPAIGRNGVFTAVPGAYTVSGQSYYANEMNESVPLLWIHFRELHDVLKRLTSVNVGGSWTAQGEMNEREGGGDGLNNTFGDARTRALDNWNEDPPACCDEGPTSFSLGRYSQSEGMWEEGYESWLLARYAYLRVANLPPYDGTVQFYYFASAPDGGVWDDHGACVAENQWHVWDAKSTAQQSVLTSKRLGNTDLPLPWCEEPAPSVGSRHARGYGAGSALALLTCEGLYEGAITPPEQRDTVADGIVDTGCDKCATGLCLPGLDEAFDKRFRDAYIKYPLGLSSGLQHGNIRVKAYIAERYLYGEPRQAFSLDTRVDKIMGNSGGEWTFAEVVRPSGVRVLFALTGRAAGQPVTSGLDYELYQDAAGYELRFPDRKCTVHRFNAAGALVQVRRTEDHHELALNGAPSSWPGLTVSRGSGRVASVSTESVVALCEGADALISNVKYIDAVSGKDLRALGATPGSRILREYDDLGQLTYETRIYTTTNAQEIWYDVTTNSGLSAAKQTIRTIERGPGEDEHTILHTDVLHPGTVRAERHVNASVLRAFDWGSEVVERIKGVGTDAALTNRFHFYNDPTATNLYGRLRLAEYSDGSWTRYDAYDARGRRLVVATPFKDAPPTAATNACRVTRYYYAGAPVLSTLAFPVNDVAQAKDHRPRLVVETALGCEVSRTYHAYLPDGSVTRRCLNAGASYSDPDALITISRVYTEGDFAGRPARVEHADGHLVTYTYSYQSDPARLTTTQRTGAHDGVTVTNGTETVRTIGPQGEVRSIITRDIASGLVLTHTAYACDAFGRTTAVSNRVTGTVAHDTYGCCGAETSVDEEGTITTYIYGDLKRLTQTIRRGVTNHYVYDVQGNAVQRGVAADGRTAWTHTVFDAAGRTVAVTNPLGHVTRYTYDRPAGGGDAVTTTYADGFVRTATSYRDGRPRSVSGAAAHPRAFDYGAGPGGPYDIEYFGADTNAAEWVRTSYDLLGRIATVTYADGHIVSNRYNASGQLVAIDDGARVTLTAYDANGTAVRRAIDMNRNGVIDLDGVDRITETRSSITQHVGHPVHATTTRVYPHTGRAEPVETRRALTAIDGSNSWTISFGRTNHTQTVYDHAHGLRTVTATAPDGTVVISVYEYGLLTSVIRKDALGAVETTQTYTYDALGRTTTRSEFAANGERRTTTNRYDALGQLTDVTVSAGALRQTTSHTYDALGRRIRTTFPDDGVVHYEFNARGELIGHHGARVYPQRYTYTDQGRLATLSTFRNGMDGSADVTSWLYHPRRGWLTAKVYPDGKGEEYEYSASGLLARKVRARGIAIDYAYDSAGDLATMTYSDDTSSVQYERDRRGRAIRITDAIGTRTNTYSDTGRLIAATQPQYPGAVLRYGYDALARRTNTVLEIDGQPVHSTAYTHDTAGRISTVSGPGITAAYAYGADGTTVTNLACGSTLNTSKRFDGLDRLLAIRSDMGDGTTRAYAYTYSQANQRTTATIEDSSIWRYEYDDLGQLVRAHRYFADATPIIDQQHDYRYDTIGNRTRVTHGLGASAGQSDYIANALNQYTQRTIPGRIVVTGEADPSARVTVQNHPGPTNIATRHADYFWHTLTVDNRAETVHSTNIIVKAHRAQLEDGQTNHIVQTQTRAATTPATPEHFTHDPDGNLLTDAQWHYTWNAENRLIKTESLPTVPDDLKVRVENVYDHRGRRTIKTITTPSNTTTHTFIYDGWNIIQETVASAVSAETNHCTYGLDLSGTLQGAGGVGGLLSLTHHSSNQSCRSYAYSFDGNGNVVNLVNTSDGSIAATYTYTPFGQPLRATGPMAPQNPFRFSTKYQDPETKHLYYGYRHYSPGQGRWLSRDPIGEFGGAGLYGFVGNLVTSVSLFCRRCPTDLSGYSKAGCSAS